MSDKKISQFNELTTAAAADLIPIVDVATNETKFIQKQNLVPDASFIKDLVLKFNADTVLEIGKINWVLLNNNHTMSIATPNASNLGKICFVTNRLLPPAVGPYTITITGTTATPLEITGENSIVGLVCVTNGIAYGWEVFSRYNVGDFDLVSQTVTNGVTDKAPSEDAVFDALALKLDLSGGNANQDIDIGNFSLNAKHVKINGTGGAGHIGLKHQSANITASASESSIGADSVGDPVWKNDGGAIDKLELQSNKTSTVTGNEASTSKYLTVKGVYDWAVGLFAPKASPTFTGTVTTPDIVVSNATGSTPAFFDAVDKLITTTAQLWGTWVQTWASKATPVDADTIGFYNSATTFVGVKSTLLNLWTTYFKVKADLLYLKSAGLTANYLPYFNGTNLVDSVLFYQANYIVTNTQAIVGKTISGGNTSYTGRYSQTYHPDYYGTDTMQAAILNTTAKGLHLYGAGLLMPYIQSSGWLSRSTGIQKYHDGQDFGGGNNPSWNYSGAYPEGVYHAYVSLNNGTDTTEAYITVNSAGNVTNIDVIKPSSNIAFSIVTNKVNIAATAIVAIFKYIGSSKVNSQLINQTYSSTGLAKYWTGSEGFGVGHSSQNASAIFQVESTAKGSIPYPRMTNLQRTNLTVNATTYGLMVYCTDATEGLYIYKSTGWTFII